MVRWLPPSSLSLAESYVNNAWDHLKHGYVAHVACNSWSSPIEKWSPIVSQTTNLHSGTWLYCFSPPDPSLIVFTVFFFNQPLALIYWNDRPHTTEKNRMPSVSLSLSTQPLSPSAPSPPPGGIRQYLRGGSWEGVVEGVGGQATLHTVYHLNKLQHWRKNLGTWPWAPWLLWFGASE